MSSCPHVSMTSCSCGKVWRGRKNVECHWFFWCRLLVCTHPTQCGTTVSLYATNHIKSLSRRGNKSSVAGFHYAAAVDDKFLFCLPEGNSWVSFLGSRTQVLDHKYHVCIFWCFCTTARKHKIYCANNNSICPLHSALHPCWPLSDVCVCVDWQPVSTASAHTWQAGETFQLGLFRLRLLCWVGQQQPSLPEPQPEPRRLPRSCVACQLAAATVRQGGNSTASSPCSPSMSRLSVSTSGCLHVNSLQGAVASRWLTAGVGREGGVGNACELEKRRRVEGRGSFGN